MGKDSWWDWRAEPALEDGSSMLESTRRTMFEELTERCVIIDNMPSHASSHTVRTALGQYGTVLGVKIMVNPWDMKSIGVAIVEMSSKSERDQVVRELREYLFMLAAMPRPARAIPATPHLLIDHPLRRNRNMVTPRIVKKDDPDFQILREREKKDRLKMSDDVVLQSIMEEEEIMLANDQKDKCQDSMEKLNIVSETLGGIKRLHGIPVWRR